MSGFTYNDIDPTVLYDIFYETGTRLGGTYVALMRQAKSQGDFTQAHEWQQKHINLDNERLKIDPDDQAGQIQQIQAWDKEIQKSKALLA